MDTHLVISAIGHDRPGLIDEFSRAILDCGCNIGDSRMAVLGSELAMMMALSGHWNAIAKLENLLPKLEESLGVKIISKRSEVGRDVMDDLKDMQKELEAESAAPEAVSAQDQDTARMKMTLRDMVTRNPIGVANVLRRWIVGR